MTRNVSLVSRKHEKERDAERQQLNIALRSRQVWIGERVLELTHLEWDVLAMLAKRIGGVVTYVELWQTVWHGGGIYSKDEQDTVRGVIKRLRRKVEQEPTQPEYLQVVRGVGIRLERSKVNVIEA